MTTAALSPTAVLEEYPGAWASKVFKPWLRDPITAEPRPFAPHHLDLLDFMWAIRPGSVPVIRGIRRSSRAEIWPRGGAKTTLAQIGVSGVAARGTRRYALYVCATQDKANEKVEGIGTLLTSPDFRRYYPRVGARRVNDYGRGAWRRNRIQTASGFTVDGIGLDAVVRGAKVDEDRPDLIILDDIDQEHDSAYETQKKIETITKAILPAGAVGNTVVLFMQNLIIAGGVAAALLGDADWLADRIVTGPIPGLEGFQAVPYEKDDGRPGWRIVAGTPTWPGQTVAELQGLLDLIGIEAFRVEVQHDLRAASPLVFPMFRTHRHRWLRARIIPDADGVPTMAPELPPFVGMVGGLDWGGEGETAHLSAGVVIGICADNRMILVDEFGERGQAIGRRQLDWMLQMQDKWGRISWRGDGSQERATDWGRELGFTIAAGDREQNSAEIRRSMLANALIPPGIDPRTPPEEWPASVTPGLTHLPRCQKYESEMQRYRRKIPRGEDEVSRREVVKVHDDVIDATMQALEEATRGTWRTTEELYPYEGVGY